MNCERVQIELSRRMDEDVALSLAAARHLESCDECDAFRENSVELGRRYRIQLRAGIDHLRRLEAPIRVPIASGRFRWARLLIPLAAAILLCWSGIARTRLVRPLPPPAAVAAASLTSFPSPRLGLFEDVRLFEPSVELSLVFAQDAFLPVRLEQDLFPPTSVESEIALPLSLRF